MYDWSIRGGGTVAAASMGLSLFAFARGVSGLSSPPPPPPRETDDDGRREREPLPVPFVDGGREEFSEGRRVPFELVVELE